MGTTFRGDRGAAIDVSLQFFARFEYKFVKFVGSGEERTICGQYFCFSGKLRCCDLTFFLLLEINNRGRELPVIFSELEEWFIRNLSIALVTLSCSQRHVE